MGFRRIDRTRKSFRGIGRSLRFECLEEKQLLAITWANEFATDANAPRFDVVYGANESIARAIVNRAVGERGPIGRV